MMMTFTKIRGLIHILLPADSVLDCVLNTRLVYKTFT